MALNVSQLLQARFKGVEFLYINHRKSAGRKTVKHEYVSSDRRFTEDLGRLLPTYSVQAVLDTTGDNDYVAVRENFEKALDSFGAGTLQLPTVGELNVQMTTYAVDETMENLGYIKYSINFEQTNNNISPSTVLNPISEADANYEAGFLGISSSIADSFNVSSTDNFLKAKDSLLDFSRSISDSVDRFNTSANNVSQINQLITDFEDQVNQLINAPDRLGSAMVELYANVNNLSDNIDDSISGAFATFDFNPGEVTPVETAATVEDNQNKQTLNVNNQAMATLTLYNLAVQKEYANVQELDDIQASIEEKYESLINEDVDAAVLEAINDIRINFEEFYARQAVILPKLQEITVLPILASKLSYKLYGDSTLADTLLAINNVNTSTYLEGKILVLSEI